MWNAISYKGGDNLKKLAIAIALLCVFLMALPTDAGIYNGISFDHEFEGITIRTSYRSDYGESMWRITDNKELYLQLEVIEQPTNTTIMIEHMHADISIHAYKEQVDGLTQDTMDDKLHTGDQIGFYVNPDYAYYETFAIEGYSKFLIEGWGFIIGSYGNIRIRETRLTERNLRRVGAQGSEVVIIYDVAIKHEGEDQFHKRIISDDFYIFFDGGFKPSSAPEERKGMEGYWQMNTIGMWLIFIGIIILAFGLVIAGVWHANIGIILIIIGFLFIAVGGLVGLEYKEIVTQK